MPTPPAPTMAAPPRPAFLPVLGELVRAYQAFERHSATDIRAMGLTPAQFDVVATLGNTEGMNPKTLGERTLITKGTLTGVVDRLVDKGLARRDPDPLDGRCQIVRLTDAGQALFERVFARHLDHLGRAFAAFDPAALEQAASALRTLRRGFETASAGAAAPHPD